MNKRLWYLFTINLLTVVFVLFDLCFVSIVPKSSEEIYKENIGKVLEIKVSNDGENWGFATGCYIDNNGLILTNKHVVQDTATTENFKYIKVRQYDWEDFIDAELVKISDDSDLALIKIQKDTPQYFKIAKKISNGETIYTIGNPSGFGLSFTSGKVSSVKRNIIYKNETIQTVQTDLVINEGNSGGPIFNNKGQLVGIVSFRLKDNNNSIIQGVAFAIHIDTIKNFISC